MLSVYSVTCLRQVGQAEAFMADERRLRQERRSNRGYPPPPPPPVLPFPPYSAQFYCVCQTLQLFWVLKPAEISVVILLSFNSQCFFNCLAYDLGCYGYNHAANEVSMHSTGSVIKRLL